MVVFHSYVSLPEGILHTKKNTFQQLDNKFPSKPCDIFRAMDQNYYEENMVDPKWTTGV